MGLQIQTWFKGDFYRGQYVKDVEGTIYKISSFGQGLNAFLQDIFEPNKDNVCKRLTKLTALTEEEKKSIVLLFR